MASVQLNKIGANYELEKKERERVDNILKNVESPEEVVQRRISDSITSDFKQEQVTEVITCRVTDFLKCFYIF